MTCTLPRQGMIRVFPKSRPVWKSVSRVPIKRAEKRPIDRKNFRIICLTSTTGPWSNFLPGAKSTPLVFELTRARRYDRLGSIRICFVHRNLEAEIQDDGRELAGRSQSKLEKAH